LLALSINQKNQDLISDMIVVTVINGESESRYNGNLKSSLGGNDQQPLLGGEEVKEEVQKVKLGKHLAGKSFQHQVV